MLGFLDAILAPMGNTLAPLFNPLLSLGADSGKAVVAGVDNAIAALLSLGNKADNEPRELDAASSGEEQPSALSSESGADLSPELGVIAVITIGIAILVAFGKTLYDWYFPSSSTSMPLLSSNNNVNGDDDAQQRRRSCSSSSSSSSS